MMAVHKWGVFEAEYTSSYSYERPFRDVVVTCTFTSPSGRQVSVEAFWDGGLSWRVRFMPDEIGTWKYQTSCSDKQNTGLHEQYGSFECIPYEGINPLYVHGPLKLSDNRRYLIHEDGTPFFWLADTAWNGMIRASIDEWEEYLRFRKEQGFTVIQFVMTHWRGGPCDIKGEKAYEGKDRIERLNVSFFKRIDPKFAMVNEYGLVATPMLLWAFPDKVSPGSNLADDEALLLARYLVARYGAYVLVWILGGDGDYRGVKARRWKLIGRALFLNKHRQLVTLHPMGKHWILPEFIHDEWYDIIGYQSGHGVSEEDLRWICFGPPSRDWRLEPHRPVINLEPNYEELLAYRIRKPITAHMVRRVAYWSLLIAPPSGISYGTNGIWYWARRPEEPINHPGIGIAKPWREALKLPGASQMTVLKEIFTSLRWWELSPDPGLLIEQPGLKSVELFVGAARSEDRQSAIVYTPEEQELKLNLDGLQRPLKITWINPRTGEKVDGGVTTSRCVVLRPPNQGDWVLVLRAI